MYCTFQPWKTVYNSFWKSSLFLAYFVIVIAQIKTTPIRYLFRIFKTWRGFKTVLLKIVCCLGRINPEFYWTSGKRRLSGQWIWGDNSPVIFSRWAPGQPDNASNREGCIRMDAGGWWNDAFCNNRHDFICGEKAKESERRVNSINSRQMEVTPQKVEISKPFIRISIGRRSKPANNSAVVPGE